MRSQAYRPGPWWVGLIGLIAAAFVTVAFLWAIWVLVALAVTA